MEKPISKTLIHDEWQNLRGELALLSSNEPEDHTFQLGDMRKIFYVGALFMFQQMAAIGGSGLSSKEQTELANTIQSELDDFARGEGFPIAFE